MIRTAMRAIFLFASFLLVVPVAAPAADPLKMKGAARALVAALEKQDFDTAVSDFDAAMKKALPPDKLKATWKGILAQAGAFKSQGAARTEKLDKYDVVLVPCEFEKASLEARIVFDADNKVAGLFFRPATVEYKPPDYVTTSFKDVEKTIGSGEWALPATLSVPEGKGPFPAVILVHGSGPHDRDETIGPNRPFKDLAGGLASRGIAALRFEKRTKVHADKFLKGKELPTIKEEVTDDALAAVKLLRGEKDIDAKRIHVLGHSLGGTLAPRIASEDESIAGIVILAGAARPLEDLILEQFTYLFSLEGKLTDEQKKTLDQLKTQIARVKDPKLKPDTPASELPLGLHAAYWLSLRDYRPTDVAAKLKRPLLILQGERDYQVTMDDFALWQKALAERKNVRLMSYPDLNHLFMTGKGKSKPAEYSVAGHVDKRVVEDIANWIKP